jgi:hypothetical protein
MILLDTVGVRRTRVVRWLADDPYPRAEVEDLPEPAMGSAEVDAFERAEAKVRRALALRAELDEPTIPYNIELDGDLACALFQLAAIAPLGPVDKQRLLEAEPLTLLTHLADLMDEEAAVLALRLAGH